MMNIYYVEYFTKDGRRVGLQVSAYTALDAKKYAESLPNFDRHANYPQKI